MYSLTLLHSERPKLYTILAFLSAIGLMKKYRRVANTHQVLFFFCLSLLYTVGMYIFNECNIGGLIM